MSLTPEWIIAIVAVGGILWQSGYSQHTLSWLKENAATKQDLEMLRLEHKGSEDSASHAINEVETVKKDIASLRVSHATLLAEVRSIANVRQQYD